ncbi:MAG: hypothetical protein ACI4RV_07690, partial [Eubacteriales bacterium]
MTADSGITAFNWYLDDVMLMPYYKITYVNDDGTVLASEQVLYDGEGKILTSYTPKADNYPTWDGTKDGSAKTCIGWSTQQNADAPMNTVALSHADVLLYPVWQTEEAGFFTADTDVMSALTGKTLEITAKTAVDSWLIDKGNTDAEIVTTDNSVTVTATGYAGEILITAVVGEETYTMTVRLFSGEKWKPGLNTVTGTEEPFDFELNDGTIFSTAFSGVDGTTRYWFAGANPSVSGINTSAQAVYVTRQFAYLHPLQSYATPIEKERPLNYAFDVMSSNSLYAMINGVAGGASGNIYSSNRGASTVWKRESITVNLSKDTCESSGLPTGAAADGIKWMGVGPKSGTYTANLSSGYVWLDNVSYVPYYKITYIGLDGETVAAVDYALYDESGNFLHEYTPNNSLVEGATGFALTPGGACKASIPLNHEDIVLYATDRQEIRFAEVAVPVDTTKPFTLPDPEEIGLDVDNFRVWLDADGNKYYAGTVYEGTALEDLIGMNLTPYSQDASMSAMGMAFEAGASAKNVNIASVGDAKANYVEYMQDDGRDILHVHTYKNTNSGTDTRISLNGTASMDANEYNIIQYSYKVNALANTDLTPVSSVEFKIFFNNTLGNGFWCSDKSTGCSGEHIPNGKYTAYVSDDYALTEIDMGLAENNYAVHGWADSGKITALYVDPAKVNVKGLLDVYIDYLRVYRDGIFTVTYDTNAPEFYEDAVLSEVAPDTGRGAGTGYLLKGERPAIDGQIFRGWALTPDATPE